jgi:Tol biopolymer transport system component
MAYAFVMTDSVRELTPDGIREQLRRILDSDAFKGATRSAKLLEYCVEAVLAGKASALVEHRLMDAWLSNKSLDEDRKKLALLRSVSHRADHRLRRYYRTEGADDPIFIGLTPGIYVPIIRDRLTGKRWADTPEVDEAPLPAAPLPPPGERAAERTPRSFRAWMVAAACLIAGTGLGYWNPLGFATGAPDPLLTLANFRRLTPPETMSIDPTITRDGRLVVYSSDRGSSGFMHLWMQPAAGTLPVQLTHGEFDDRQPSFSAEGNLVAYHSEQDGGGVFVISVSGGRPRKVAPEGRSPRISPDGKWVAYWIPGRTDGGGDSKLFVAGLETKSIRRLRGDFLTTQLPVWAPDSKHLLFIGRPRRGAGEPPAVPDWWVTPIDDSAPVNTGALTEGPRLLGLQYGPPWHWQRSGNVVLFEAMLGETRNLWAAGLSSNFKVRGMPRRITKGVGRESQPATSDNGRIVFTGLTEGERIWSLPLEANEGKAAGGPKVVTSLQGVIEYFPASASGGRMAYVSPKSGSIRVFLRDAARNSDVSVADGKTWSPIFSRDGSTLAYLRDAGGKGIAVEILTSGGVRRDVPCNSCMRLFGFSPDGNTVLYGARGTETDQMYSRTLNLATGENRALAGEAESIVNADWSPDGRFIALTSLNRGEHRIMVMPSGPGGGPVPITDGFSFSDNPRWSPDGKLLYFFSDEDMFRCLYAVRINPATGGGLGPSWVVHHFHQAQRSPYGVSPDEQSLVIRPDAAYFTLEEARGSIWVGDPQ